MNQSTRQFAGFTLIELMITLVVVAILASIAIPSYSAYTLRNTRVAVQAYMSSLAGKQEQYLLDARSYATATADLATPMPNHLTDKYTVTMTAVNTATPPTFLITATPIGGQVSDSKCSVLTLSSTGAKTASGSGGVASCW